MRELEFVKDIGTVEMLAIRLPDSVGSPLSINARREDIGVAHQSVARWLDIFERIFYIFRVHPFRAPSIRAVKKEAKHYHYDWTQIANEGFRFECLAASDHLRYLKARFPKVEAVQVVFRSDIDIRNADGIRIVGADIFLRKFI